MVHSLEFEEPFVLVRAKRVASEKKDESWMAEPRVIRTDPCEDCQKKGRKGGVCPFALALPLVFDKVPVLDTTAARQDKLYAELLDQIQKQGGGLPPPTHIDAKPHKALDRPLNVVSIVSHLFVLSVSSAMDWRSFSFVAEYRKG